MESTYCPFSARSFQTGILITGLGTPQPYVFRIKRRHLEFYYYLLYDEAMYENAGIDSALAIACKHMSIDGYRIYFDSSNQVDVVSTIVKRHLSLKN